MFEILWHDFLYRPLFNVLIWIYNNVSGQNLGWAVVILTVALRLALLPLTVISEYGKAKKKEAIKEIGQLQQDYRNDFILQKEEVRKILKKRRIYPWAKAIFLGVHGLMLLLLYQVFLHGITGEKVLEMLYPVVNFPGYINTDFYGFDLGTTHDVVWPGAVAIFFILTIYFDLRRRKKRISQGDMAYFVFFPLSIFIILWVLPVVKSLFFLTTLLCSMLVGFASGVFTKKEKEEEKPTEAKA